MENSYTFEEKIGFIRDAILKYVSAKYIYLYGSYAYGEPSEESDIDILAVIPDEINDVLFLRTDIICHLRSLNIRSIDLHLHPESHFSKHQAESLFLRTICQNGRLLYEFS